MHLCSQKMRQVIAILASAVVAGALVTTVTSASATTSQTAATTIALKGSIAGGITVTGFYQTVTFVFTETNRGTVPISEFLDGSKAHNTSIEVSECVYPGGVENGGTAPRASPTR